MKSVALVILMLALCHYGPASAQHRDASLKTNANMNFYFDSLVVKISHFFETHGLDPMPVPDIGRSFHIKDLIGITWQGEMMLKEVNISGLSMLHRSGDATLGYDHKLMDIEVELGFDDVKLNSDFVAEIMNIGPHGKCEGDIRNLKIKLHIKFDIESFQIFLQELKITDAGNISVKLHGAVGIIDLIADAIVNTVTTIFHDVVVDVIASTVKNVVEKALSEIDINCIINGGKDCFGGDY